MPMRVVACPDPDCGYRVTISANVEVYMCPSCEVLRLAVAAGAERAEKTMAGSA